MVLGDDYDFPYENIGFDTPCDEGGVLMCFTIKEQSRNCHMYHTLQDTILHISDII